MTPRPLLAAAVLALAGALLSPSAPAAGAQAARACSVFSPCPHGFSCQPFVQRCYNAPRLEGQPCSAGFGCGAGLRCVAGVQKCVSAGAPPAGAIERTVAAAVPNACPDEHLRCPTGEPFDRGTSWDSGRALCRPANQMATVLRNRCTSPWAGRPDGGAALEAQWWAQASQPAACSAPGFLRAADSELFNEACIIHDLCYRSPMSKAACDRNFLLNQQAVCYRLGVPSALGAPGCLALANNNYLVVLKLGQAAFDEDQRLFGLQR